jgi:hypothetical protein
VPPKRGQVDETKEDEYDCRDEMQRATHANFGATVMARTKRIMSIGKHVQNILNFLKAMIFMASMAQENIMLARIFHKMTGFSRLARVPEEKSRWTALVFWRRHCFGLIPL